MGPRPLLFIGCFSQGAGIALLSLITKGDDLAVAITAYALMGFGGSLCSSAAQTLAFIDISNDQLADASALWNINRQLSFCLGTTFISLLLNALLNLSTFTPVLAYQLCFLLAAVSSVIPALISLRIANQSVLAMLNQETR